MAAAGLRASHGPHGRLVVSADEPMQSVWAANVWRNVEQIPIRSIGHAAKELRDRQRNWALYGPLHGGRAKLIAARLPSVSAKPVPIGGAVPDAPLGSWTLLEPDLMLAAGDCSSPFPNGEARLVEDRRGPPSRGVPQVVRVVRAVASLAEGGRDLPRPRRQPWRLDMVAGADRSVGRGSRQGAPGRSRWTHEQRALAAGLSIRPRPSSRTACRLAVQRHHLLPTAPAGVGAAVARRRHCSQHHLHDQVPRRHRPGSGTRVPGHPRWACAPPAPQPPRADLHPPPGGVRQR